MIEKIICESDSQNNYEKLSEERKLKYQEIYNKVTCCPEEYILGVDVASPDIKDCSCVVKYNYEEFIKGNLVVESVEYF